MTGFLRKHVFGVEEDAPLEAANVAAQGQQDALDYLKETEALPRQIRDEALQGLSGYFQTPDQLKTQDQLVNQAMSSPLYNALIGNEAAGLDTVRRQASMMGGGRSGNLAAGLFDYQTQNRNQALISSYNEAKEMDRYGINQALGGLQGLSGIGTREGDIANLMASIAGTQAQGLVAKSQLKADSTNNIFNTGLGLASIAAQFSDIRLKENIELVGKRGEVNWYSWNWRKEAEFLGLTGPAEGVLAHEVYEIYPEAIDVKEGLLFVDYDKIPGVH